MKKIFITLAKVVLIVVILVFAIQQMYGYFLREYGWPTRDEYIYKWKVYNGFDKEYVLDADMELTHALHKYTNWDRLFLSDHFKEKYKNRKGIIPEINKYEDIVNLGGEEVDGYGKVSIIYLTKKPKLFQNKDDVTEDWYYVICIKNDKNELDDLYFIKKEENARGYFEVLSVEEYKDGAINK